MLSVYMDRKLRHMPSPMLLSDGGRGCRRAHGIRSERQPSYWPLSLCCLSMSLGVSMSPRQRLLIPSPHELSLPLELLSEGHQSLLLYLGVQRVMDRPSRRGRCGVVVHMHVMGPAADYNGTTATANDDLHTRTGCDVRRACDGDLRKFNLELLFVHSGIGAFQFLESFLRCSGHLLTAE